MTPLFLYLLKVNIALLLFYLAYRYGLRRLTFYTLNRFYLLFAIGFSSAYPLINVNAFLPDRDTAGGEIIRYLPDLGNLAQENPLELWNVLPLIFWSGVIVMAIRFLLQCISLVQIHLASVRQRTEEQDLHIVNEKINPFSFFRNIYINPRLHSPEEQQSILAHERVHVEEWHTADILTGELNRIFYWFNPGAWLMITAIRENLEFITDRRVLKSGADAKAYQYSLVKAINIPYASTLANNFNFSHLKIRITMMDKKPSSELHLVKYLVLVPFVAAMALAFNVTKAAFTPPVIVKLAEPQSSVNDTLPEKAPDWETNKNLYKGNFTGYAKTMASISHIDLEDPVVLNGKLTNGRVALEAVRKDGIGFAAKLENELARYYIPGKDLLYWLETKSAGKAQNRPDFPPPPMVKEVKFTPPEVVPKKDNGNDQTKNETPPPPPKVKEVKFSPPKIIQKKDGTKVEVDMNDNPLYIIDEKKSDSNTLKSLPHKDIAVIDIYKGENAVTLYGEKAKDGVVVVTTKKWANKIKELNKVSFDSVRSTIGMKDALLVINGKVTRDTKVEDLKPDNIKSISILKGQSAMAVYGEKGKNGVIIIRTKKGEAVSYGTIEGGNRDTIFDDFFSRKTKAGDTVIITGGSTRLSREALYVINGEIIKNAEAMNLDPESIDSLSVLKGQSAIDKYGKKGGKGVIEITTKEEKKP